MITKKNPEIPMVPKAHLKNVEHQRDEYKAERDKLVDELSWYKAKVSRLERENRDLKHENKALRLQSNTYFDEWKNEKLTSQGLREQCKEYVQDASKYTTLTNHIRLKAENNPGVSRYIDLVNYIDRLERADNER
ncbi:hypothetical protein [Staphylococcus pseudoxylosus]|uniref:Uncharacterized protein n=1 Tax=Staphylococcus pseudoxylosus TaxID=2282419 RepID=A0AAQ0S767_9STAP|nr:hypothetical protein [Staphylococcus pseudoxylosus]MCE5001727.1 hypothetical protein [Staphylococcus pseudoxylosus]RMI85617.1 hypothetical protein D9V42_04405 [Staphylococcus pseudoxylosus]